MPSIFVFRPFLPIQPMSGFAHSNRIYGLLILIIGIGTSFSASSQVDIRFPEDTIVVKPGTTGLVNVLLVNPGYHIEKFIPRVSVNEIRLLNQPGDTVELHPKDQRIVPVRFFIPRRINADTLYRLNFRLSMYTPAQTEVLKSVVISVVKIHETRVIPLQNQLYANHPEGVISFQLKCNNLGNSAEPVFFQIHNEYGIESASEKISGMVIPAFTDTVLDLHYKLPSPMNQKKIAQLHIIGKYLHGNQTFSSHLLKVNNLRPASDNTAVNEMNRVVHSNTIAVFVRNANNSNPYYELMADFKQYIGKSEMHYHINGFYYTGIGISIPVALLNTYIELNRDRLGIRLGQISKNLEMPLYGRGASIRLGSYEKTYLEAGFVNGDNNLLANFKREGFEASNSVYAKGVQKTGKDFGIKYQLLRISDPYNQVNSIIAGIGNEWKPAEQHALQWMVYKSSADNYQFSSERKATDGMAGEFSYNGHFRKFSISTLNYYSSKAYAGFLKGALNLDEKITYAPGNQWMIWARYHQFKNQPDFFSPYAPVLNFRSLVQTTEAGIRLRRKKADISFKPVLFHESTDYYKTFLQTNPIDLQSGRLGVTVNFRMRKNRFLSISGDMGYSKTNVAGSEQYSNYRASAFYQTAHIVLNAAYQNGAYYAAELVSVESSFRKYLLTTVGLTLKDIRLSRKLLITLGNNLSYNNAYQLWSNNSFANASFNLNTNLALVANYSRFRHTYNLVAANTQSRLDLGIVKKLNAPRRPQKQRNASVEIQVYLDLNGNRHYDAGEPVSPNTVVRMNEMPMVTDMNGRAVFPKMEQGSYTVSVIRQDGYMGETRLMYIAGNTSFQVPLYKIGILTGTVSIQKEKLSYETDERVNNIRILAIDPNGTLYTAVTDEKGQYIFYLPENTYDVQLDVTSLPEFYEIINAGDRIRVNGQAGSASYQFSLKIKKRPVEIKKFNPQPALP